MCKFFSQKLSKINQKFNLTEIAKAGRGLLKIGRWIKKRRIERIKRIIYWSKMTQNGPKKSQKNIF